MMVCLEKNLAQLCREKRKKFGPDAGAEWLRQNLQESFDKGEVKVEDFSLRRLAQQTIDNGFEYVASLDPDRKGGFVIREAAHAVDTSAFANITGQLFFNAIKDSMQLDELIGDKLFSVFPSTLRAAEIVPGISDGSDEFEKNVTEGEPFPLIGLSEEVVTIPATEKKGGILGITREALIADRTGVLVQRAQGIGKGLAIRMEKSRLNVFIGAVNPYIYNGEARLTYGDGATAGQAMGFINEAVPQLINYSDLQEMGEVFYTMRDPKTGEPLGHTPTTIVCTKNLAWTARHVIADTQVTLQQALVRAAGANEIVSTGINRIPWDLEVLANEWLMERILLANGGAGGITAADRAAANAYWWLGKPKAAFIWKELWPLTVEEAPSNNEAQFTQDVWIRFKASYSGVAGVMEPRLMIRSDGTA